MPRRLLLISGSTREGSTNSAFVRTAVAVAPPGVDVVAYRGLAGLPHFNPDADRDPLPPAVAALRRAIAGADGVVFCTPEYAGTLPGSLKNLLDWCVGGTELSDKRVAWINVAADPRRGAGAHAALDIVLRYVQADIAEEACASVPIARDAVGADGLIADAATRAAIGAALARFATGS
jgi:NAD(P)H-dependent FMN reductase